MKLQDVAVQLEMEVCDSITPEVLIANLYSAVFSEVLHS
jgi:hypothetical protein